MGSCTRRHFLLSTCFLQMITIIERQVFDFLGYMWLPIIANFLHILFIIFGFYGAYHFRIKYIVTYLIWNFVWIGWNAFLICFYMNVGELDRDSDLLNVGTGSVSWFEVNGYGCKPTYSQNLTIEDPYRPIRPERVDDCLLDYTLVEVIHAGVQAALALLGVLGAILISYIFLDEDDRLKHVNKKSKHRQSLYSIEFGPSLDSLRSRADTILDYDDPLNERDGGELSPKPMTPRRVKRRSVMARGTNSRQSTTSRRSGAASSAASSGTHTRSSTRSSRRKYHQNPVTKLLDQQQQLQQHHHSHHHGQHQHQNHLHAHAQPKQQQHHSHSHHQQQSLNRPNGQKPQFGSFHHKDNVTLTATNLQTLNQEIIGGGGGGGSMTRSTNNIISGGSLTKTNNNHYHSFRKNIPPDPIYYNTNAAHMAMFDQQPLWPSSSQSPIVDDEPASPTYTTSIGAGGGGGHFNPTYQHSTTNLNDGDHVDDMYNNRPPSVRSSYSNFHGTRPLSSYLSHSSTTENVFVGLSGAARHQQQQQQQQQQHQQHDQGDGPSTPPLYQAHPLHASSSSQQHLPPPPPLPGASPTFASTPPQNIPFAKRTASRESIRSMAFLNSGPPAYNLNYHTPPDSETTM